MHWDLSPRSRLACQEELGSRTSSPAGGHVVPDSPDMATFRPALRPDQPCPPVPWMFYRLTRTPPRQCVFFRCEEIFILFSFSRVSERIRRVRFGSHHPNHHRPFFLVQDWRDHEANNNNHNNNNNNNNTVVNCPSSFACYALLFLSADIFFWRSCYWPHNYRLERGSFANSICSVHLWCLWLDL